MHAASIRTEYLGYQEHRDSNQLMHYFAHQMTIILLPLPKIVFDVSVLLIKNYWICYSTNYFIFQILMRNANVQMARLFAI